ncbi:MAG: hypothetical protein IPK33_25530 [Gemmatimonadetes bacterium]|nr:hypothetical protein [Gemmatimonadota bacterium]
MRPNCGQTVIAPYTTTPVTTSANVRSVGHRLRQQHARGEHRGAHRQRRVATATAP